MTKPKASLKIDCRLDLQATISYLQAGEWRAAELRETDAGYGVRGEGVTGTLVLRPRQDGYDYDLTVNAEFDTRVRFELSLPEAENSFHLIPCNIHGDNNLPLTGPGEYPHLTDQYPEDPFCSPLWEFRADRAALPVSILCSDGGAAGISIDPYSDQPPERQALNDTGFIRNGVFAALPDSFGVSLGYGNDPGTFLNKRQLTSSTMHTFRQAKATGRILYFSGDRGAAHRIMRELYADYRQVPRYEKDLDEAMAGMMDAWLNLNWGPVSAWDSEEYYRNVNFPHDGAPPWDGRPLCEIGWTGGGVIAYPFALAENILGLANKDFGHRKDSTGLIDMIVNAYNTKSGFLNDLTREWNPTKRHLQMKKLNPESMNNGWWAGYVVANQHTAYNNGTACYYILKTIDFRQTTGGAVKDNWLPTVLKVLDNAIALQREDGNFGYAYCETEPRVDIREGFAGCWFAAACAYAAKLTGEEKYQEAAERAVVYYYSFVKNLNCYGTPMDTWMSVDQEGVLALIRACRLLHEISGDDKLLKMLNDGAEYEYLWRYGFKARPEFAPLKGGHWNSCGGSVTSVSNPHIHPMGVYIADDLRYLAQATGDDYHRQRAEDSIAWAMQCLELYPETTGFGRYGMLTERYCPSDGLVTQKDKDGRPYAIWRVYNGWAAAAVLEGLSEAWLDMNSQPCCKGGGRVPVTGVPASTKATLSAT